MSRKRNTTAVYYAAPAGPDGRTRCGWLVHPASGREPLVFVEQGQGGEDALRGRYPDAEVDPTAHRIAADYYDLLRRTYAGKATR